MDLNKFLRIIIFLFIFGFLALVSSKNCNSDFFKTERQSRRSSLFHIRNGDHTAEINLAFEIPFFQIPVKRSITGMQSMTSQLTHNSNALGTLNMAGLIVNIMAIISGMFIAGIDKTSENGLMDNLNIVKNFFKKGRINRQGLLEDGMYMFEKTFQNYNVDSTACAQRFVCWLVKKANKNVIQGEYNKIDRIIEDLSNSTWSMELIAGTVFENAVVTGKNFQNCEQTYKLCSFK